MLSWFFGSLSQLFLHVHQQVLLISPSKYTKEPTSLHLHTTALAKLPDLLFEDSFLSRPVRCSLSTNPEWLRLNSAVPTCSPPTTLCCALNADRLLSWAYRPPRTVPSSPPTTSHLLLPLAPCAPCAHTALAALSLPKLVPILGISSLLLPQPGMLLPLPAGWLLPVIQSSDSRLPYSERPVLTGHTQSNQPTVPCTVMLVASWLSPSARMWSLRLALGAYTGVTQMSHHQGVCYDLCTLL